MPTYPTTYKIEEMFANVLNASIFNTYLADSIDMTMVGQDLDNGGSFKSVRDAHKAMYDPVKGALKFETLKTDILRVVGGGDSAWAAVDTLTTGTSKYETPYHQETLTLVRFNTKGKIAQMKMFLDSKHIEKHVEHHEAQQKQ